MAMIGSLGGKENGIAIGRNEAVRRKSFRGNMWNPVLGHY